MGHERSQRQVRANAFKVQAFLGHADLSTTRRYVRDTADGLREAARVLELASPQQVTAT
ncbi:MAG TPA: hypothetical protein VLT82_13430 [Myxococcaceae bacterium]|nr:hypothetical protein [Myxococcaceae bacterium]